MAILQEDVSRVRGAVDLVELVGERTALKRRGRRWVGLCPFHAEKTPSFSVNAEEGLYYCFGCGASGDAITFVRETEGLGFSETVERLADRAGIVVRYEEEGAGRHETGRQELLDLMAAAVAWYHTRLQSGADAARARAYLRSRGYDAETVRFFQLGWAPASWDALCKALKPSEKALVGAGLGFVNRIGKMQDSFSGRIVFPIFDPVGRPVALGGRVLPDEMASAEAASAGDAGSAQDGDGAVGGAQDSAGAVGASTQGGARVPGDAMRRAVPGDALRRAVPAGPKYKNSPETAIYSKRRTLYGLNWAKEEAVRTGETVVCEGYTDVIAFFQVGLRRAVATCGTALTEDHLKLLAKFAPRVVLAYDADAAGQAATARVYEWERLHDLDIRVAVLPPGLDPSDLAARDPDALREAVATAIPLLALQVEQALSSADLGTGEGRARAAESALRAVAVHPSDLVRDQYIMTIADHCRVEPASLRKRLDGLRKAGAGRPRQGHAGPASASAGAPSRPAHAAEARDARGQLVTDHSRAGGASGQGAGSEAGGSAHEADHPLSRTAGHTAGAGGPGMPGGPGGPGGAGTPGAGSRRRGPIRGRTSAVVMEALRLMVHSRGEMIGRLEAVLFPAGVQRDAFKALVAHRDARDAAAQASPEVADLLRRVAVQEPSASPDDVVTRLVEVASRKALADLEAEARSSEGAFDEVAALAAQVRLSMEELYDSDVASVARDRLLAWLVARDDGEEDG